MKKGISSRVMVGLAAFLGAALLFGPSVSAHFIRYTGDVGWGYGEGIGYGYGYGWDGGTYAGWRDINEKAGTLSDDDTSPPIPIGFTFPFYGTPHSSVFVNSNGGLTFNGHYMNTNGSTFPDSNSPNDMIAGAWTDLYPPGGIGSVTYDTLGIAPNRLFVVHFEDVAECCGSTPRASFSIVLHETSGVIDIHHDMLNFGPTSRDVFVGLEDQGGISFANPPGWNPMSSPSVGSTSWRFSPVENDSPPGPVEYNVEPLAHVDMGPFDNQVPGNYEGGEPPDRFRYGDGWGWLLPHAGTTDQSSYVEDEDEWFEIDYTEIPNLIKAGILGPIDGATSPTDVSALKIYDDVLIRFGDHTVFLHNQDEFGQDSMIYAPGGADFSGLFGNPTATGLPAGLVSIGGLQFGLPTAGISFSTPIDITLTLTAGTPGDEVNIMTLRPGGEWQLFDTCIIDLDMKCYLETTHLSAYAAVAEGGGSSYVSPSANVSIPNGGESWAAGSQQQLFWGAGGTDVTGARVSYSIDGGSSWTVISSNAGGGFMNWTVPSVSTTMAKIKVEAMGGGSVLAYDTSDAYFTIVGSTQNGGGGGGGTPPPTGPTNPDSDDGTPSPQPDPVPEPQPPAPNYPEVDGAGTSATGPGALPREEANQQLPIDYPVDSLVKLADDGNPDTQEDTTVYYVGLDAKRHPFPTPHIYKTWYENYDEVILIDAATLASIPMGAPILVRPGSSWVKIVSDPRTYFVGPGYRLHWLRDEATAIALGGDDWATRVMDVSDALFGNFTMGETIDLASLDTAWPTSMLLTEAGGDGTVWLTGLTDRRPFVGLSSLTANYFQTRFIREVAPAAWMDLAPGAAIGGFENELFSLMH